MYRLLVCAVIALFFILVPEQSQSQGFLKKLKDKANQVADKALDKKIDEKTGMGRNENDNTNTPGRSGKPMNKGGEGLKNTAPPDVIQQITDAQKAHDAGNFSDARYAVQQAILGVEIQIGQSILKSLPAAVGDLPKDTTQDIVMSTRWGWANLSIQRVYKKNDQQLSVVIGNNPMYSGMMDLYFSNAYATQSNGETQNMKQIKVKGNKAAIKFEASEGYSVFVTLGQSGMITWQGINYATEQDMMNAVNVFDIEGIKTKLGEK